ncbi:MAG: hypothetical protein ABR600_12955 [Actinomycetota bacterium]
MADSYVWDVRNPDGGAMGLEFARGRSARVDVILVHAAPSRLTVEVRNQAGVLVAKGRDLTHDAIAPMSRLTIADGKVTRENVWPEEGDVGTPVMLPGGEFGVLQRWWNDDVGQEWKWSVEFHGRSRVPLKGSP